MKKLLVILSVGLLALCGLVATGAILAQNQPEGKPFQELWQATADLGERIDNEGMPLGAIIMWSGDIDTNGNPIIGGTPDTNWQICDGSNGTPDLRDRFVVGSGLNYFTGDVGGENSVPLTVSEMPSHVHYFSDTSSSGGSHSHSLSSGSTWSAGSHSHSISGTTNATGSHRHGFYDTSWSGTALGGVTPHHVANDDKDSWYDTTNYSGTHSHSVSGSTSTWGSHTHTLRGSTGSAGYHTHNVSGNTGMKGGNSAHENRPPYYALAFIMKIQ